MLAKVLYLFIIPKIILAQINGEFWWLNNDIKKIKGTNPPPPVFEDLTEFDTDESSKIIFREDLLFPMQQIFAETDTSKLNKKEDSFESASVTWSNSINTPVSEVEINHNFINESQENKTKTQKYEDTFIFKFPDSYDTLLVKLDGTPRKEAPKRNFTEVKNQHTSAKQNYQYIETTTQAKVKQDESFKDVIVFQYPKKPSGNENNKNITHINPNSLQENMQSEKIMFENVSSTASKNTDSEFICSYVKKSTCFKRHGTVYTSKRLQIGKLISTNLVCCILPLPEGRSRKIVFPDSIENNPIRLKRSTSSMVQRDFLMKKIGNHHINTQTPPSASNIKVVTPEDDYYIDPYWNIKNSNSKSPNSDALKQCNSQDYVDDYVVELPKPGLVGIYSDHGQRPPSWFDINDNPNPSYGSDEGDDDESTSFGYSTVDPRRGTSKVPKRGRPIKITTTPPDETNYDLETQTVNFQSNPNFQVLQGFKLLNLGRNKNKFYTKISRSTTEGIIENDSGSVNTESGFGEGEGAIGVQVFDQCGKTIGKSTRQENQDKQVEEARPGMHPWLAIAVASKKPQAVLCYVTIVHPRAAVTAADCVSGYSNRETAREVVLIAGLRDIKDKSQTQNRKATIQLHPQYRRKNLAHNLALLHWERPLQLNPQVQPACLGGAIGNEDCKFVGWGGFDQALQQRPRWQRAALHVSKDCATHFSKPINLPSDAFCATVETRGTVTGIGGSLLCNQNGRVATVGVAVYRDIALVLLPAQDWVVRALVDLAIV